jgi:hypothetical protein
MPQTDDEMALQSAASMEARSAADAGYGRRSEPDSTVPILAGSASGQEIKLIAAKWTNVTPPAALATSLRPLSGSVRSFSVDLYYPSTLHLLGLSYVAEKRPRCL